MGTADNYWHKLFTPESFGANEFKAHNLRFDFTLHYLLPEFIEYLTYYSSFIWVACSLPNRYLTQRKWVGAFWTIILGFLACWFLLSFKTYLIKPWEYNWLWSIAYSKLSQASILYIVLLLYQAAKQAAMWLLSQGKLTMASNKKWIANEVATFVIVWLVVLTSCTILKVYWGGNLFIAFIVPCAFATYLVNVYWLIPRYWHRHSKVTFWIRQFLVTLCLNAPLNGFYSSKATYASGPFLMFFTFMWLVQLLVIIPLSLYVEHTREKQQAELTGLRTNLGASAANLQFLRSQINPHFLFNALNTLYGMALTEKAEQTSEGIQKLGDMMRFMLHENQQDKIALQREIDYLTNYINLQNMRIAASPAIEITMQLPEVKEYYTIAPMLLIPFVENAYKHGISLKERSWIHISLQVTDDTLHFDVHNSIHANSDDNPEKNRSGIGLDNVQQRLQLLYPQKHELIIRPTLNEFFIHLTIQLS
ncbi:histidine kinase [Mucilaginibacter robiniae]|uniref:Histidine kinase n=2 Tax=Mucilaginibacter robiniae TaxID=2728022 RepID=A0A7L5E5U4_9SPHI|nr:histidine kinase [Mucilaginibacter robiniae]